MREVIIDYKKVQMSCAKKILWIMCNSGEKEK